MEENNKSRFVVDDADAFEWKSSSENAENENADKSENDGNPMSSELDRIKSEIESGNVTRRTLIALQYVLENLKADMENLVKPTAPKTEADLQVPEEIENESIPDEDLETETEEQTIDTETDENMESDSEMDENESDIDADLAEAESIISELAAEEEEELPKKKKSKKKTNVKENAHGVFRGIPIEHEKRKEGEADLQSIEDDIINELRHAGYFKLQKEDKESEDKK